MITINSIEAKSFYIILSILSQKAYLDKERKSFVFFQKREAEEFVNGKKNTKYEECSAIKKEEFVSQLYHTGTDNLVITDRGSRKEFPLNEVGIKPDIYTHELSGNVNLFLQTKEMDYIKSFDSFRFFIPIKARNLQTGPEIKYATARTHGSANEEFWYLLFTDRLELEKWKEKAPDWEAIQISFDSVCQIGSKHGFLVNPMGKKFLLPTALLNKKGS